MNSFQITLTRLQYNGLDLENIGFATFFYIDSMHNKGVIVKIPLFGNGGT